MAPHDFLAVVAHQGKEGLVGAQHMPAEVELDRGVGLVHRARETLQTLPLGRQRLDLPLRFVEIGLRRSVLRRMAVVRLGQRRGETPALAVQVEELPLEVLEFLAGEQPGHQRGAGGIHGATPWSAENMGDGMERQRVQLAGLRH